MLQSHIQPTSYSLRGDRKRTSTLLHNNSLTPPYNSTTTTATTTSLMSDGGYDDDADLEGGGPKGRSKSRRELPTGAVATLKAWLLSPEHFTHPYPTPQDQAMLMQKTGIDKKQLKNWFTNARRRIWKPMLKKQIESGKLSASAPPSSLMPHPHAHAHAVVVGNGMDNPHSVQAMRVHYQQAMQGQPTEAAPQTMTENYGTPMYATEPAPAPAPAGQYYGSNDTTSQGMAQNSSIGTLAQISSSNQLSKTDSHAVLMELFARDQDLVRQATESARLKQDSSSTKPHDATSSADAGHTQNNNNSQHPMMKAPSSGVLSSVPTLTSWPQFSSITSLNNLGTIPGVKSITSMSGQDLASKGNVNKMGNLAQVKSMESMGKNDSYAFLEVFFGDRSSGNLSSMGRGASQSNLRQNDEDNEIGLSLEDESPSHHTIKKEYQTGSSGGGRLSPGIGSMSSNVQSAGHAATIPDSTTIDAGTLKRAYDDALAARGLMSVSRSCEKLTDLVLPAKIQRTLSQEFINKAQQQTYAASQQQQQQEQSSAVAAPSSSSYQQYAGQQATGPQCKVASCNGCDDADADGQVQVSSTAKCVMCSQTNVDTQLRPCGHMFHERCLKPSLTNPIGAPKCPIDDIPIHSAVLAVPDNPAALQEPQPPPPPLPSTWAYNNNNATTSAEGEA